MDPYGQESYHREDCSDDYSNTNNERALRRVNYPAEETSGSSLQRFEVVKDFDALSLPVDHTTYSVPGDWNTQQHRKISLAHVPQKRSSGFLDIEENCPKRYCGSQSPNIVDMSARHTGSSKVRFHSVAEEALDDAYNGQPTKITQRLDRADIYTASPRTPSNKIWQKLDARITPLGSPIWKNDDSYNRGLPKESAQARSGLGNSTYQPYYGAAQCRNVPVYNSRCNMAPNQDLHPRVNSKISYDTVVSKALPTLQKGAARSVMKTTNLILSQISKDSLSMNGSISPQIPVSQATAPRSVFCPVHTNRGHSKIKLESSLPKLQLLSYLPKSETVNGDSDESEDAPIEQLLNRMRYARPRSRINSMRSPYKTSSILPRANIIFTERSETKPVMLPTIPSSFLIGGGPSSPICVDSPPGGRITKKPLLMKACLPYSKTDTKGQERFDALEKKQQRAAETIINKEQGVTDKEIFGEIIQDKRETTISYAEAQQQHNSKEKARLIKEKYKRQREREARQLEKGALEIERLHRDAEEEIKKVRREAEIKKQLRTDDALKGDRRRMAEEQIEASRLKEVADKEKREQDKKKEILAVTEAATRREMEPKREIAKLQAASLKPATTVPKQSKKVTDLTISEIEEENPVFAPDTQSDSDQTYEFHNESRITASEASSLAKVAAKPTRFRSRHQVEREPFEAEINSEAEKTRMETLKARLDARRESTAEKSSTHRSAVLGGGDEYFMKSNRSASKSKAELSGSKTGKRGIFSELQSSVAASDSVRDNSSIRQIPELTIYNIAAAVPQPNKYSSEIKLASNIEPKFQQDRSRAKKSRSDRQNEERRKKDGEKARDRQRERLVEEATEGGYTISNDEIEKRLDAYMRKREEKYQKMKEKRGSSQKAASRNQAIENEHRPESTTYPPILISTNELVSRDQVVHENDHSVVDPEQQKRDQNEMVMREAMAALAKSSCWGSRFANTAAKRTVDALKLGSEASEDSEESEEDPDDVPTVESALAASRHQNKDKSVGNTENKALNPHSSDEIQIEISVVESKDASDSSPTKVESLLPTDQNTLNDPIQCDSSADGPSGTDSRLVRVYTVKILQIIDGEEQPPEDLKKFLDLSDANGFAEDKTKEYQSVDDIPSSNEHAGQLFRGQIVQDDKNSTQIWVISEIIPSSKIPNFDPEMLGVRFPSSSWLIRFETMKDVFDERSETTIFCKVSEIIPDLHYSDIELANYAAAEYLIKFLKPRRPIIDHLQQYENEVIPEIRRVRDDRCEERAPFQCGLEKGEAHVEWLAEKEVEIEVVQYQMRGPLN